MSHPYLLSFFAVLIRQLNDVFRLCCTKQTFDSCRRNSNVCRGFAKFFSFLLIISQTIFDWRKTKKSNWHWKNTDMSLSELIQQYFRYVNANIILAGNMGLRATEDMKEYGVTLSQNEPPELHSSHVFQMSLFLFQNLDSLCQVLPYVTRCSNTSQSKVFPALLLVLSRKLYNIRCGKQECNSKGAPSRHIFNNNAFIYVSHYLFMIS